MLRASALRHTKGPTLVNSHLSQHPPTVRRSGLRRRLASLRPGPRGSRGSLERLTASTTAGGMLLAGVPLMMEYVVRPGDTLSEIAADHGTSVSRIVARNGLDSSGDHVVAGQTLRVPAAHGRGGTAQAQPASSGGGSEARRIVRYTVRPGDTPSGLAVRFHAWTAELVEMNGPVLRAGETIRIPVVPEAARDGAPAPAAPAAPAGAPRPGGAPSAGAVDGPSRARVRSVIESTARRHGVDPQLALAVSWQEAGWQMHHVSYADAVGAMQVIPSTGRWMSGLVGRDLDLTDVHDNVTAGVKLLDVLGEQAPERTAVAGYYQGLAGVRKHGMYDDTRRYVANVMALKDRFERGDYPA